MRALEIIAFIGAALGAFTLFVGMSGASGAPQEAAAAGIAIALTAIPYCVVSIVQRRELIRQGKRD